jgi:hypothetical protein
MGGGTVWDTRNRLGALRYGCCASDPLAGSVCPTPTPTTLTVKARQG